MAVVGEAVGLGSVRVRVAAGRLLADRSGGAAGD